jgi:hypothetical protein
MIGLDSNYYTELNNDSESYSDMRHREAEEARKGHEEWERVRVSLLAGNEESGYTLNERLIQETDWAAAIEDVLKFGVSVIDLYKCEMLGTFYVNSIESHARTLASIIVGAEHE